MLDDNAVTDAARRLLAAERMREPIRQLLFVHAGDVVHADFGDLGAVTCRFR